MRSNEKVIWDFLKSKGLNDYAVAGIMGNLYAESGLNPINLQQIYNSSLGMSDEEYTQKVDEGRYTNFVYDQAGYGLAQWTYWSRKRDLYDYAKKTHRSIGDLQMQLEYLWNELQDFTNVLIELKNAQSVRAASNVILNEYEIPYDRGINVQNYRAEQSMKFYNQFANGAIEPVVSEPQTAEPYSVIAVTHCYNKGKAEEVQRKLIAQGFEAFISSVSK